MAYNFENVVETDFLVVGAGPAGSSMGAFLGQNGMKGIVISSAPGTADTPRAHLVNPFAIECLRDIGLDDEAKRLATQGEAFKSMRWCRSMVGEEYGKVLCWSGHPNAERNTNLCSPCDWIDLPQTYLEPLIVKYASHHGFDVRFSTEFLGAERLPDAILCTVQDSITKIRYQIRARYVFGADGGRSSVARMLDFKFISKPSLGVACNILINADLSNLMRHRHAQLHWIMKPDLKTRFGIAPCLRMVRPWNQWLLVAFTPGTSEDPFKDLNPRSPELINFIKELIGDDTIEVEVLRLDPWVIRDSVAETFSSNGNAFILGDAAHRHPPAYGLGSNTCIQDAYNLAWKAAYVTKGLAGPELLETYNAERQPVGADLVEKANAGMVHHTHVWEALGMFAPSGEEGLRQLNELSESTDAGVARRLALHKALEGKRLEGESLGLTMNQWYTSKTIYLHDEPQPRPTLEDPLREFLVSTYPGNRLPHAWLDVATRKKPISTQDLAGHGSFCLLTSHGGDPWKQAAKNITKKTGIPISTFSIGIGLDYHDVYREWHDKREIGEAGCILVRPDRFVAWRSMTMISGCEEKLLDVFDQILFRAGIKTSKSVSVVSRSSLVTRD